MIFIKREEGSCEVRVCEWIEAQNNDDFKKKKKCNKIDRTWEKRAGYNGWDQKERRN